MGRLFTICLAEGDVGQLLDGLRCRSEAWHGTAEYMASGHTTREDFVIEECRDADEALKIAAHYDPIIATIEAQVRGQAKGALVGP